MEHPPVPLHKGEKNFSVARCRRVAGVLPPVFLYNTMSYDPVTGVEGVSPNF